MSVEDSCLAKLVLIVAHTLGLDVKKAAWACAVETEAEIVDAVEKHTSYWRSSPGGSWSWWSNDAWAGDCRGMAEALGDGGFTHAATERTS